MSKALFILMSITAISGFLFSPALADVLINEIMADPARDWDGDGAYYYRDDEWVEVINTGDSAVDLSEYLLCDGESPVIWRYGFSGILDPGEVRVVFGSDSRLWEESNGFPVYGLSLNNSGDAVSLFRCQGADTLLVDEIVYEAYVAEDDRTAGRSAEDHFTWELFDAYNPYSGSGSLAGNGCLPTPGTVNTCVTDAENSSWGVIKSMYGSCD